MSKYWFDSSHGTKTKEWCGFKRFVSSCSGLWTRDASIRHWFSPRLKPIFTSSIFQIWCYDVHRKEKPFIFHRKLGLADVLDSGISIQTERVWLVDPYYDSDSPGQKVNPCFAACCSLILQVHNFWNLINALECFDTSTLIKILFRYTQMFPFIYTNKYRQCTCITKSLISHFQEDTPQSPSRWVNPHRIEASSLIVKVLIRQLQTFSSWTNTHTHSALLCLYKPHNCCKCINK